MKLKKGSFRLDTVDVPCLISPCGRLAVHRRIGWGDNNGKANFCDGFVITHLPTKLATAHSDTMKGVRATLAFIKGWPWDFQTVQTIPPELTVLGERFRPILRGAVPPP